MNRIGCEDVRRHVTEYRRGEIHSALRAKVDAHLQLCAHCAALVAYDTMVDDARAQRGATTLDAARESRILLGIRGALARDVAEARRGCRARSIPLRWVLGASAALAAAAALAVVVAPRQPGGDRSAPVASSPVRPMPTESAAVAAPTAGEASAPETPRDSVARAVPLGSGISAFAAAHTRLSHTEGARGSEVRLTRGTLYAQFDRKHARGPLRVKTPHAEMAIVGTVFLVRVDRATTVSVARGRVEVVTGAGERVLVDGGRQAYVAGTRVTLDTADPDAFAPVQRQLQLPAGFVPSPTGAQTRPSPSAEGDGKGGRRGKRLEARFGRHRPRRGGEGRSARSAAGRGGRGRRGDQTLGPGFGPIGVGGGGFGGVSGYVDASAPPSGMDRREVKQVLATARDLWRQGDEGAAVTLLDDLLRLSLRQPMDEDQWEDTLYLLATIHRSAGDYHDAARTLRTLSSQTGSAARLAALEYARLISERLGRHGEATRVLEDLLQSRARDVIAEEGAFELCVVLVRQRQQAAARSCIGRFLQRFPEGARAVEARELEKRLESSKP